MKLFFLVIFLYTGILHAQDLLKSEGEIIKGIKWANSTEFKEEQKGVTSGQGKGTEHSSLNEGSGVDVEGILLEVLNNPGSINYPFESLKKIARVTDWQENKFRIFSWDVNTGDSSTQCETYIQYKIDSGKVRAEVLRLGIGIDSYFRLPDHGGLKLLCMGSAMVDGSSMKEAAYLLYFLRDSYFVISPAFNEMGKIEFTHRVPETKSRSIRFEPASKVITVAYPVSDWDVPGEFGPFTKYDQVLMKLKYNGKHFVTSD